MTVALLGAIIVGGVIQIVTGMWQATACFAGGIVYGLGMLLGAKS